MGANRQNENCANAGFFEPLFIKVNTKPFLTSLRAKKMIVVSFRAKKHDLYIVLWRNKGRQNFHDKTKPVHAAKPL